MAAYLSELRRIATDLNEAGEEDEATGRKLDIFEEYPLVEKNIKL